jgi:hypothetical protein
MNCRSTGILYCTGSTILSQVLNLLQLPFLLSASPNLCWHPALSAIMYSYSVSLILIGMIFTGAARSVLVKLFYQLGFRCPLFVTLLYLLGQSLSLIVYFVSTKIRRDRNVSQTAEDSFEYYEYELESHLKNLQTGDSEDVDTTLVLSGCAHKTFLSETVDDSLDVYCPEPSIPNDGLTRKGSATGLTDTSHEAVAWVHKIPWYLKLVIPGICNLCNSAMRWASLLFVPASVAEILISGLELVLSVCAARIIRKVLVLRTRWIGVSLITFGLVSVGIANALSQGKRSTTTGDNMFVGNLLIVGQCVMSVTQDMAEELFMDVAGYPATLILGMEGLFGLIFGILLYYPLASIFGENMENTWDTLTSSSLNRRCAFGLTIVFTVTGIFNIMATAVTSSMTRNVWKNCRTMLVWLTLLLIYYASGNVTLGEPWLVPDSFAILGGFLIMLTGIYVYYDVKWIGRNKETK